MKIEELMIGDWVYWFDSPHKICIGDFDEGIDYNPPLIEILKPIPITPKILEKNGFEYDIEIGGYWSKLFHLFPIYDRKQYPNGTKYIIGNTSMCISNVHELQHALKLCGIDKDINL